MQSFLTEQEVSKRVNVSVATLRRWRLEKRGPIFVKVGSLVRYRPEDLDSWVAALSALQARGVKVAAIVLEPSTFGAASSSLGVFASVRTLPRSVALAGAWYFVSGFAVVLLASHSHTLSPWTMGLPFVIGQSVMAGILYFASGENDVEDG